MQDGWKAVWSIPCVFVTFFPSLKQNFIAYHYSKVSSHPDCIFEIHQLWQSGFSRVYSNCCCSCWFEPEIIKIGQSSHKMYSNNILNYQESTTILNARTKKLGNLLNAPHKRRFFEISTTISFDTIFSLHYQKKETRKSLFLFMEVHITLEETQRMRKDEKIRPVKGLMNTLIGSSYQAYMCQMRRSLCNVAWSSYSLQLILYQRSWVTLCRWSRKRC